MSAQPARPTADAGDVVPTEIDPRILLAQQQEQHEADMAQLNHLRARVPVLRAQLNVALEDNQQLRARIAELEQIKRPTDRRRATTKRTTTKAAATTKGK